jgi:hypothetical protein
LHSKQVIRVLGELANPYVYLFVFMRQFYDASDLREEN